MVAMATQESKAGITRDGVAWTVAIAGVEKQCDIQGESVDGLNWSGVMANICAAMVLPEIVPVAMRLADDPSPPHRSFSNFLERSQARMRRRKRTRPLHRLDSLELP
jgi:hypothetical protein